MKKNPGFIVVDGDGKPVNHRWGFYLNEEGDLYEGGGSDGPAIIPCRYDDYTVVQRNGEEFPTRPTDEEVELLSEITLESIIGFACWGAGRIKPTRAVDVAVMFARTFPDRARDFLEHLGIGHLQPPDAVIKRMSDTPLDAALKAAVRSIPDSHFPLPIPELDKLRRARGKTKGT